MAKAEKTQSTEVAVPQNNGVIAAPGFLSEGDFGGGFEGADGEAYAIPFLQVLQKMSPLVDEDSPKHIEGAKAGMIYNNVTQKLTDGKTGLLIIPCAFKRSYIRWGSREADGGFKGEFTPEEFDALVNKGEVKVIDNRPYAVDENGQVNEKKSDYYADTRSHYVITVDEETGETGQAIISLAASQIRASRNLMTALNQRKVNYGGALKTPPTFANVVRMTTIGLSNDKGNWSSAKFEIVGLVEDANHFQMAREFNQLVKDNKVNVDHSKNASAADQEVSGEAQTADTF